MRMRTILNKELIDRLIKEGKSRKEISDITGYNKNSVYGYCIRTYGCLEDRGKSKRQSIDISDVQKEFLFGTLMGDGNLRMCGKNTVFGRTNHSIKQEAYCIHKISLLKGLTYGIKYTKTKANNKEYNQCYFCMKPNENLIKMYNDFYKDGAKIIPEDLSLLTPRAMALWFMDDGYPSSKCSIGIATCSFSLYDLERLKSFLLNTYGIEVVIQKDRKLYFRSKSAIIFYNLVKEFIIDEMQYKFKFITADVRVGELPERPVRI